MVYSTNKAVTHHTFPLEHVTEALKGKVVTDLEELSPDEDEVERKLDIPLYEFYSPLRDSSTEKSLRWANSMKRPIASSARSIVSDSRYGRLWRSDAAHADAAVPGFWRPPVPAKNCQ